MKFVYKLRALTQIHFFLFSPQWIWLMMVVLTVVCLVYTSCWVTLGLHQHPPLQHCHSTSHVLSSQIPLLYRW